jgi:hypothetical protein
MCVTEPTPRETLGELHRQLMLATSALDALACDRSLWPNQRDLAVEAGNAVVAATVCCDRLHRSL